MPPSSVIKVQSIYIVGSKYYFPLCLLVPLSKPFHLATEQTNDETSVMVFWHFQKIQHVISNLEGLNLHPNMSSVKLTQAHSFVLWGKNKFKEKKKDPQPPPLCTYLFMSSQTLRDVLPEQVEILNACDRHFKCTKGFCSY